MTKVLLINKFNYAKGGADGYFLALADLLKTNRWETVKFCMAGEHNLPDEREDFFVSQIDFHRPTLHDLLRLPGRMIYSFEAAHKLKKLIRQEQPDIVHVHNIYHQLSPSVLVAAKKFNLPVVMTVHDWKLICPNYNMFDRFGSAEEVCDNLWHCLTRRSVNGSWRRSLLATAEFYMHHRVFKFYERLVDLYLAPSQFVKDKLVAHGYPADKIKVLPLFVSTKAEPEFRPGDYALFVGRLVPEKGLDVLIEAMGLADRNVKLKIAGLGPEYKHLAQLIKDKKLSERVELVGPKFGHELVELTRQAGLLIVPSVWPEVFGLVSLEAQAVGKPVLAAEIGGLPETLKNNQSGWLFKAGDAKDLAEKLNRLYFDKQKLETAGRAGRALMVTNFSAEKHYRELNQVYRLLINAKLKSLPAIHA